MSGKSVWMGCVALALMVSADAPGAVADPLRLWPFPAAPTEQTYPLLSMRCGEAMKLVAHLGSVRLVDAQGVARRYVPEPSRCRWASARDAWVRTRDLSACAVGFTCEGPFSAF